MSHTHLTNLSEYADGMNLVCIVPFIDKTLLVRCTCDLQQLGQTFVQIFSQGKVTKTKFLCILFYLAELRIFLKKICNVIFYFCFLIFLNLILHTFYTALFPTSPTVPLTSSPAHLPSTPHQR